MAAITPALLAAPWTIAITDKDISTPWLVSPDQPNV